MSSQLIEYKYKDIYRFLSIIQDSVENEVSFWNFNEEMFVDAATKFNRITLLDIYVTTTLFNYYHRMFKKDGDCIESDEIDRWIEIMKEYEIIPAEEYDEDVDDASLVWFEKNIENFADLFDKISPELVHILFNDKQFLFKFNSLVQKIVKDEEKDYNLPWPKDSLNEDGTIKRQTIPQWVKNAVYHRDKGPCVFCSRDLTGLVNVLRQSNYDHIIPLKQFGTNDPCNIQLTCEECNKSKGAQLKMPKYKYQSWW